MVQQDADALGLGVDIVDVRFGTVRGTLCLAGIDQQHLEPSALQ